MPRYAAFLRGINVGKRRAGKEALISCFEDIDLDAVATFRASGNVVFSTGREARSKLTARIERALADALGFEVAVFLRSETELKKISAHDPFDPKLVAASKGKLQVAFLEKRPSASATKAVTALSSEDDRLAFGARELFWLPKAGLMESELDQARIDELLGLATVRTMGTVQQLAAKFF
jgi:uncharacterized protein (DUF1697 family)